MTQLIVTAVKEWLERLEEPPEPLRVAKHERIMSETSKMVDGYICRRGHVFWVDMSSPIGAMYCPECGSQREIRRIWSGTVRRGS